MSKFKILLREKYYLDHFEYLIAFIKAHYLFLLNSLELKFVQLFETLSPDARCLLARLYNRQGAFFSIKTLKYEEIADIPACLNELFACGLVESLQQSADINFTAFLRSRTCHELRNAVVCLKSINNKMVKSKAQLIELIASNEQSQSIIIDEFVKNNPVIVLPFKKEYLILRFLLFGNLKQAMSQFVVKELKGTAPLVFTEQKFSVLFKKRQEVEEGFAVQSAYLDFKANIKTQAPAMIYTQFLNWRQQNTIITELAQRPYHKLAVAIAKYFERLKLYQEALVIYATTDLAPANERRVRIHAKLKQLPQALQLCEVILKKPNDANELMFAQDFIAKINQKKMMKATSLYLKNAEKLSLTLADSIKPEQAVINHLSSLSYEAYFTENYLWKGLFGLLLWDILFDEKAPYFHHPFQMIPSDLLQGKILQTRGALIETRLKLLDKSENCMAVIKNNYSLYNQTANGIVNWHPDLLLTIEKCCYFLTSAQLRLILTEMARDWRTNSTGFPDLLCWREEEYCFIEVKSTFDKLSTQQLKWLLLFKEIGIAAKVMHVSLCLKDKDVKIT